VYDSLNIGGSFESYSVRNREQSPTPILTLYMVLNKIPCEAPETRFKARTCISEPGLQEPYRGMF
jgi:hypothetical protein